MVLAWEKQEFRKKVAGILSRSLQARLRQRIEQVMQFIIEVRVRAQGVGDFRP